MVTLHDLSHRAESVSCATTVQCDQSSSADEATISTHVVKVDCALCHFVHTPFLGLTGTLALVALLLSLCELLTQVTSSSQLFARLSPQLRAPPTLA